MPSETNTPNIGLQVPGYNQPNWQVPINYDLNLLDLIFGGEVQVPGLSVLNLVIGNAAALLVPFFVAEAPGGAVPGTAYTLSQPLGLLLAVFLNGVFQPPTAYALAGGVITFNSSTSGGDTVYALYFKS